jgi:hypothetical protein
MLTAGKGNLPAVHPTRIAQDHHDMEFAVRRPVDGDEHRGVDHFSTLAVFATSAPDEAKICQLWPNLIASR